jgi:hypothetical protein
MDFRWNEWNLEHVTAHGVTPAEAERVVLLAGKLQRFCRGDNKWAVWGRGVGGGGCCRSSSCSKRMIPFTLSTHAL